MRQPKILGPALGICLGLLPAAAVADAPALERCRQIADPLARLNCYDAVMAPQGAPSGSAGAAAPKPGAAAKPEPGSPTSPQGQPEFGLEWMASTRAALPESLSSHIPGQFEGWVPKQRLSLANGQVWEITDGSEAAYSLRDPKVLITRGFSGSFFMKIEGVYQTPRVRRLR